jgi:MarR family transcriptional regulator, transcriptional regulator for hemolysin
MDDKDWDLRLGYLIHDVSRLRRTIFDRWLSSLAITRSQWWVLAFLSRRDGMPQTQLAQELDVGKVALGALIDRLESSGFVERQPDPQDRRLKRIFLTKQSKKVLKPIREKSDAFNARILKGISRRDLDVTASTLRTMKHNLLEVGAESQNDGVDPVGMRQGSSLRRRPPPNATFD